MGKNEEKSVFYWNRTILIRVWCNWITFWHLHTKNRREFVWNLITSSKYLTFNILREYWVAWCVFFYYRSFDFRTYFFKNPVHSVFSFFSGRFSFFCRNRLTLMSSGFLSSSVTDRYFKAGFVRLGRRKRTNSSIVPHLSGPVWTGSLYSSAIQPASHMSYVYKIPFSSSISDRYRRLYRLYQIRNRFDNWRLWLTFRWFFKFVFFI